MDAPHTCLAPPRRAALTRPSPRRSSRLGATPVLVAPVLVLLAIPPWLVARQVSGAGAGLALALNLTAVVAVATFLPALATRYRPVDGPWVRLRRALDGVIAGLCLMFCGWALLVPGPGSRSHPAFWIVLVHGCALGVFASTRRSGAVTNRIIAVLATLALTVALHRLATGREIDRAVILLGTLAVLVAGARQLLVSRVPAARDETSGGALAYGRASAVPRPRSRAEQGRALEPAEAVTGLVDAARLRWTIAAMRAAPHSPGALLLIGIHGGDALADGARDEVDRAVATRLRSLAAEGDRTTTAARWSAAEFAVLTPANLAHAFGLAHRLVALLTEPVRASGGTPRLSVCVGLADLTGATSTDDAVHRAQVALRRALQLGPGRVEWYDSAVAEAVARRAVLQQDLPGAVDRGELDLIYQPIIDLERGRPLAVEALLRWRHPRLGTMLPTDVIPVAEETGVIGTLDRWVLRRAAAQLASWRGEGRNLSMAINVSPHVLRDAAFPGDVATVLARHSLPPDRLVIEVAEPGMEAEGAVLDECVTKLRSIGVRTALDEFGTGVASLAHLRRLPIDMVKIGRSFFEGQAAGAATGLAAQPLIDVMVGVGRRLGVDVVAHGVEVPAHLTVVRTAGCRLGQGHLFAGPQTVEHTEAYLDGLAARP